MIVRSAIEIQGFGPSNQTGVAAFPLQLLDPSALRDL